MQRPKYTRLIMLGTALDTYGGIAAVVNVYRDQGLFERWPIDYVPTHCGGGVPRKLLTAAKALYAVTLLLVRHRRVVMHVHVASHASFWRKSVFMALGMLAGSAVVFHLHGGGFRRFYESECSALGRYAIRFFIGRATRVIVLSEQWKTWIEGITKNRRLICLPNPVTLAPGQAPARRRNVVLFLGRLERSKGVFDLVDALCALRATVPDARLVCAGDGDRDAVARYAERLGIRSAVRLPGWIGPGRKRVWMCRAAAFVLPSYAEGLPMSLLEAMASGVPVVATAVGGIPDIVTDGVNGFLFAPGDTARLGQLLHRLMRDAELADRIAAAGRDTVRIKCGAERVLAQLEDLYAVIGLSSEGFGPPATGGTLPRSALCQPR